MSLLTLPLRFPAGPLPAIRGGIVAATRNDCQRGLPTAGEERRWETLPLWAVAVGYGEAALEVAGVLGLAQVNMQAGDR